MSGERQIRELRKVFRDLEKNSCAVNDSLFRDPREDGLKPMGV